jgi:hypothetical protein
MFNALLGLPLYRQLCVLPIDACLESILPAYALDQLISSGGLGIHI